MLNIEIGKKGIRQIYPMEGHNVDDQEIRDLFHAIALPVQLLHNSALKFFGAKSVEGGALELGDPVVWVHSDVDGLLDLPRLIVIKTHVLPRDVYDGVPPWFTSGIKKLFPDDPCWKEWAKPNAFSTEMPYCSLEEEQAVFLFQNHVNSFSSERILDHWGWVSQADENDVLVSEPYAVDQQGTTKLAALCERLGWAYQIKGISAHYPGSTIRIEIKPKGQRR